jgi:hypothetical protein
VEVYGDVKDSFTQAFLKAFVTVMDKDSNVIDTMTTSGWEKHLFYHTQVPARPATYIVKSCVLSQANVTFPFSLIFWLFDVVLKSTPTWRVVFCPCGLLEGDQSP